MLPARKVARAHHTNPGHNHITLAHVSADYEELSDEELPVTEEGNKERREVLMEGVEEEEEVPAWIFVSVNYDPYSFRFGLLLFLIEKLQTINCTKRSITIVQV